MYDNLDHVCNFINFDRDSIGELIIYWFAGESWYKYVKYELPVSNF